MREIKFRAWDTGAKKWETTPKLRLDGSIEEIDWDSEGAYHYTPEPDQYIIEQYTGLKDKNGKEIYDGDIIQKYVSGAICKVYWDDEALSWYVEEKVRDCPEGGLLYPIASLVVRYEVIGNIHENPELLGDINVTNKEGE